MRYSKIYTICNNWLIIESKIEKSKFYVHLGLPKYFQKRIERKINVAIKKGKKQITAHKFQESELVETQ